MYNNFVNLLINKEKFQTKLAENLILSTMYFRTYNIIFLFPGLELCREVAYFTLTFIDQDVFLRS